MIETNVDNCVGPLHCFCRTKFFSWDREKALPIDQSQSKEISSVCQYKGHCIQIGTLLILYSGRYKYVAREQKVSRGATQLEQFNNYCSAALSQ